MATEGSTEAWGVAFSVDTALLVPVGSYSNDKVSVMLLVVLA